MFKTSVFIRKHRVLGIPTEIIKNQPISSTSPKPRRSRCFRSSSGEMQLWKPLKTTRFFTHKDSTKCFFVVKHTKQHRVPLKEKRAEVRFQFLILMRPWPQFWNSKYSCDDKSWCPVKFTMMFSGQCQLMANAAELIIHWQAGHPVLRAENCSVVIVCWCFIFGWYFLRFHLPAHVYYTSFHSGLICVIPTNFKYKSISPSMGNNRPLCRAILAQHRWCWSQRSACTPKKGRVARSNPVQRLWTLMVFTWNGTQTLTYEIDSGMGALWWRRVGTISHQQLPM